MGKIVRNNSNNGHTPTEETKAAQDEQSTQGVPVKVQAEKPSSKTTRTEIRKELVDCVNEAHKDLTDYGFDKMAADVTDLTKKAVREKFSVCVVGEFSHGKSTLINKLLGVDALPTDTLPTTSLLTRITSGNKSSIEVLDNKGKLIQRLPLDSKSWDGLTAFDENGVAADMENRYLVKLTIDNDWLKKTGIDIYDTPGANDGSKSRDLEISRALMLADGALVCIDAQKGIMMTQEAFLRDRLLSPRIPYVAIAVTHLDVIDKKNRDRVVTSIFAKLKDMKVTLPVIITNDVEMPSDKFKSLIGIEKLRAWLKSWQSNPDRSDRINAWVAAGVKNIIDTVLQALEQKKQILAAKNEEREKLVIEKQATIAAFHDDWETVQNEIDALCVECQQTFKRKLVSEQAKVLDSMLYRIQSAPDPNKWYMQHYKYELSNRISASIISLDNVVTENARNDLEKINRIISSKYKTTLERDGNIWRHTPDTTSYVHSKGPEMKDLDRLRDQSTKITAMATVAGGLLASLTFGLGGIIGTVGATTCARHLTQQKIAKEVEKAREQLTDFVESDIASIINDATRDCQARISLIYSDIKRAVLASEGKWMEAQMDAISTATRPMQESAEKAEEHVTAMINKLTEISDKFNKFIN